MHLFLWYLNQCIYYTIYIESTGASMRHFLLIFKHYENLQCSTKKQ